MQIGRPLQVMLGWLDEQLIDEALVQELERQLKEKHWSVVVPSFEDWLKKRKYQGRFPLLEKRLYDERMSAKRVAAQMDATLAHLARLQEESYTVCPPGSQRCRTCIYPHCGGPE